LVSSVSGVQRAAGLHAAEQAEEHERVKGEAEPGVTNHHDERVDAKEHHAHNEGPQITFVREDAQADEKPRDDQVQSQSYELGRTAVVSAQYIQYLSDAKAEDETPVTACSGYDGINK